MERLFEYAHKHGVTIGFVNWLDPKHPGAYYDEIQHIDVLDGMSTVKTLSVLGHELGHHHYRDVPTMFQHLDLKQERRADAWAAHFLIPNREYRIAEEKYGANTEWIAQDLGVLERLVVAYENTLTRIGEEVYVSPRMGAGQWAQKIRA